MSTTKCTGLMKRKATIDTPKIVAKHTFDTAVHARTANRINKRPVDMNGNRPHVESCSIAAAWGTHVHLYKLVCNTHYLEHNTPDRTSPSPLPYQIHHLPIPEAACTAAAAFGAVGNLLIS